MPTPIHWDTDDDQPVKPDPPSSENADQWLSPPSPAYLTPEAANRALFLGSVDVSELITELNKRGYLVSPAGYGYTTPSTLTTSSSGSITTSGACGSTITPTFTWSSVSSLLGSIGIAKK